MILEGRSKNEQLEFLQRLQSRYGDWPVRVAGCSDTRRSGRACSRRLTSGMAMRGLWPAHRDVEVTLTLLEAGGVVCLKEFRNSTQHRRDGREQYSASQREWLRAIWMARQLACAVAESDSSRRCSDISSGTKECGSWLPLTFSTGLLNHRTAGDNSLSSKELRNGRYWT